jgi:FtsP/CotA-like multicopper oxidase with cupredoxin domain
MNRRQFLAAAGGGISLAASGFAQASGDREQSLADIRLRIQEITLELAPNRLIKTIAYNGQAPGPVLRAPEGRPVTVDVFNETKDNDIVHWHGFHIPPEVDGSREEGTPDVPAGGRRRYIFTPSPAGTRWYHSHNSAGRNLHRGTYSGQFGMFIVEPSSDPGRYDLEVPLVLHGWDPSFEEDHGSMDVAYRLFSINGKLLGAGEPVRVREGQRVLFRIVNASATLSHRLALPGHQFEILALDGNPVPAPGAVRVLELAPGERVDAAVEMRYAGVWILGEVDDKRRAAGMGIVVEYANAAGQPRWAPAPNIPWDYTVFGHARPAAEPDTRVPLIFKEVKSNHHWTINGKSFPKTSPILVKANRRYRLTFDNQSADPHPVHLHRHTFELIRVADKPTGGILKDVVVVPAWKEVEVDVTAANPGPTLFHCHQQFHMDSGFMTMMLYTD